MNLKILLVESDPEEAMFLQDVLTDMENQKLFRDWARVELFLAMTWAEAEPMVERESLNAVILTTRLPDCKCAAAFRRAQAIAPHVPVLLVVDLEDELLAIDLVREGVQDYLIRATLDSAPLARALRSAIERQLSLTAARAATTSDFLTGLVNRRGFLTLADRDRRLAEWLDRRWMMIAAEPADMSEVTDVTGQQRHDLELIETAERLRKLAGPTDLVAWMGDSRFGMAVFEGPGESLDHHWARLRVSAATQGIHMGAAMFERRHPRTLKKLLAEAEQNLERNTKVKNLRVRPPDMRP